MIHSTRHESCGSGPISPRLGRILGHFILSVAALIGFATPELVARQTPPAAKPDPLEIDGVRVRLSTAAPASIKDLLPTPPSADKMQPATTDDLAQLPELQLQMPLAKGTNAHFESARLLSTINDLNSKSTEVDGFLKALLAERRDLAGLPFAMGDACRTKGERNRQFTIAVNMVRSATAPGMCQYFVLFRSGKVPPPVPATVPQKADKKGPSSAALSVDAASFWMFYGALCAEQDSDVYEHVITARIAALMQILGPESASLRLGLVKYLATIAHPEAAHALARLALFSGEDQVRLAAIAALQDRGRDKGDYTDLLIRGLRYPWPAVSRNAADAIVRLKRNDLLPQLVAQLEEDDPRAPETQKVGTKEVTMVREMVRINHHRNCALCHSPGNNDVPKETLTVSAPLSSEPLTGPPGSSGFGYGGGSAPSPLLVRLDVTYLRQDFSRYQAVVDPDPWPSGGPWPDLQRFDFMVRTREVTVTEADAYRKQFGSDPSRLSAYQKAALAALREMTGSKDTAPTGEAWRKLLGLPARTPKKDKEETSAVGPISRLP